MFVVTGSTGQVGGAVVRALIAQGKQVRALLRDEAKIPAIAAIGAEAFLASVEDASLIEQGFEDAEAVFVMTPPLLQAPDPRTEHMLALAAIKHALLASHVPKVVYLSSIGAQHAEGTGAILKAYDMEQSFADLGIDAVSIRAAYFMENLLAGYAASKQSGKLPVTLEPMDRAIPMVATQDIGELAAKLMTDGVQGKRIVELEGPRQYSMWDAARVFSQLAGRTIEPVLVPRGERQAMYESFGITPGAAEALVEMGDGLNSGNIAFAGGSDTTHMQGATTLEDVFRGR